MSEDIRTELAQPSYYALKQIIVQREALIAILDRRLDDSTARERALLAGAATLRDALWSLRCEVIETGHWRDLQARVRGEVTRVLDDTA